MTEREGQIGRQQEGKRQGATPPEWREYQRTFRQISFTDRRRGSIEGVWPEGTSQIFIDLYTKSTPAEKLLMAINFAPSAEKIQEIRQRTPEDLKRLDEESEERHRQWLTRNVGEPSTTELSPDLLRKEVEKIMGGLSPAEADVLKQRFGLEDGRSRTQREIAEQLGRSPRTVGRIEKRALAKLRTPQQP